MTMDDGMNTILQEFVCNIDAAKASLQHIKDETTMLEEDWSGKNGLWPNSEYIRQDQNSRHRDIPKRGLLRDTVKRVDHLIAKAKEVIDAEYLHLAPFIKRYSMIIEHLVNSGIITMRASYTTESHTTASNATTTNTAEVSAADLAEIFTAPPNVSDVLTDQQ